MAAPTDVEKRQHAAKLVRVRRDLKRLRSEEAVYSKQIDILGTQIHHLTLTERGKRVAMPSAEELTREAAAAEQTINELSANADLVSRIEINAQSPMQAAEEADILKEFEEMAAKSGAGEKAPAAPAAATPMRGPATAMPGVSTPQRADEKSKARPELS